MRLDDGFVGLATVIVALFASAAATLVGAAGPEIAPWAQVGGTATAVGALAYVAKLLADGRLVAQPVAERERKLIDLVEAGVARERKLDSHLEDGRADRDTLRALLLNQQAKGSQ